MNRVRPMTARAMTKPMTVTIFMTSAAMSRTTLASWRANSARVCTVVSGSAAAIRWARVSGSTPVRRRRGRRRRCRRGGAAKSSVRTKTVVLTMLVPSVDRPLTRSGTGDRGSRRCRRPDAELVGGDVVDEDLAGAGGRPAARRRAAAAGGGVVAEDVGGELPTVVGFDDAGRVAQPFGPGDPVDGRDRVDGLGRGGPIGSCAWCGRPLGDEHVGGRVAHVGVDLVHGAGEDAVEDQDRGRARRRRRRRRARRGDGPGRGSCGRGGRGRSSSTPIGGGGLEAGEPAGRDDGGDESHQPARRPTARPMLPVSRGSRTGGARRR